MLDGASRLAARHVLCKRAGIREWYGLVEPVRAGRNLRLPRHSVCVWGFRGITTRAPFRCVDGTEFRKIRVCCAVTDYANALRAATTSTSPQPSCNTRALLRAGSRHNQCIVNPHAAEDSTRSLTMQQTVLARPATSKGPYPHLIEWWHALQP